MSNLLCPEHGMNPEPGCCSDEPDTDTWWIPGGTENEITIDWQKWLDKVFPEPKEDKWHEQTKSVHRRADAGYS
jgi:hypothetical protein